LQVRKRTSDALQSAAANRRRGPLPYTTAGAHVPLWMTRGARGTREGVFTDMTGLVADRVYRAEA